MNKLQSILLIVVALTISLSACVKKDFDEPPYDGDFDPQLPVNMTIKELKSKFNVAQNFDPVVITDDVIIYGIVTANDESGNFYKQFIIQDSTGAIPVKINRTNLYNDYPVGRKVYIKCKGLSLGDYGDFIQLGLGEDEDGFLADISTVALDDFVIKASYPNVVEPRIVTVSDVQTVAVSEELLGMLIKFERVQVSSADKGKTYADDPNAPTTTSSGVNRVIESCGGDEIIMRTSNYCNFQAVPMPDGSGSVTGIYSRFGDAAQVLIRDPRDVTFDQDPCPFGQATDTLMRIADLRNLYTGTDVDIYDTKIRGVVISDPDDAFGNNITSKNMVLQDGDRGIVVRFANSIDNNWAMGDSLEIIIGGQTLNEFARLLQIGDQVTADKVLKLGTGTVTPREAAISDIIANFEDWESTLVTIKNATFVSGENSTYQGSIQLNDNSTATDFPLFTQFYSSFVNVPAPIGETKDVTGFLYSITSTDRISIRRLTDVQ